MAKQYDIARWVRWLDSTIFKRNIEGYVTPIDSVSGSFDKWRDYQVERMLEDIRLQSGDDRGERFAELVRREYFSRGDNIVASAFPNYVLKDEAEAIGYSVFGDAIKGADIERGIELNGIPNYRNVAKTISDYRDMGAEVYKVYTDRGGKTTIRASMNGEKVYAVVYSR